MDKAERKRLERLQEDGHKEIDSYSLKTLTYPDLQLLLLEDPVIQDLIRQIVSQIPADESVDTSISLAAPAPPPAPVIEYRDRDVIKEVTKEVVKFKDREVIKKIEVPVYDPLRSELNSEISLLKAVQADTELTGLWFTEETKAGSEGRQLVRLVALLSDWDEVLRLWNCLKERCKVSQRPINSIELDILQSTVALHNLRNSSERTAQLLEAEINIPFHHDHMERGTAKGSSVQKMWLPGLRNAGGAVVKKPLVALV